MPPAQMKHLVHHDVLQTLPRLASQVGVQPDRASRGIAAAPLGAHPLDVYAGKPQPETLLPSRHQIGQAFADLGAIPLLHELAAPAQRSARADLQRDSATL